MLASLSGVFFIWKKLGKFIEKNLSFLVSFSSGVFLFVTYLLSTEAIHQSHNVPYALLWIFIGAILFFALFKILPQFHHHHDEKEECGHPHSDIDARKIMISDGVHNIGDGILLTVSFAAGPIIGIFTTISIFVHEFVQEISEFFVLRQAGFKTKKALLYNFIISATILIGAIGSYFLFEFFKVLEVPLLGISAGSFLVVVINDLIPHSIRNSKNKTHYLKHFVWFLLGLGLMFVASSFAIHSHETEGHGVHHKENHQELNHKETHNEDRRKIDH